MSTKNFSGTFDSPLGRLRITGTGNRISAITPAASRLTSGKLPAPVRRALEMYFSGRRSASPRFSLDGTPFQKKVWKAMAGIPWGSCMSYSELARRVKKPRAVRAVAQAVGSNPVMVLLPCHRVIGSDGSLTGYAYGLKKKAWLLRHEKRNRG